MHRETVLLHGGRDLGTGVHSPAARLDDGGSTDDLGRRLAALDGTDAAVVLASGMAATTCTLLALLGSGDHLVASRWLPGRVRRFLQEELAAQGIDVTFVDPTDARGWRRAVRQTTRVLFLESPADPSTRVIDLQPTSALAQEHGIALVIDSTFASPINFRPTEHGADVVIHASTTLLSGSADAVGGVVCGSESLVDEVRRKMAIWGPLPDPAGLALLARGLTTLAVRVRRMEENAMQLAEWASAHQAITAICPAFAAPASASFGPSTPSAAKRSRVARSPVCAAKNDWDIGMGKTMASVSVVELERAQRLTRPGSWGVTSISPARTAAAQGSTQSSNRPSLMTPPRQGRALMSHIALVCCTRAVTILLNAHLLPYISPECLVRPSC